MGNCAECHNETMILYEYEEVGRICKDCWEKLANQPRLGAESVVRQTRPAIRGEPVKKETERERAIREGQRLKMNFASMFPQGQDHEVYALGDFLSWSSHDLSKCNVKEPYIRYIAQNTHKDLCALFSEIEIDLGGLDFGFAYMKKYNRFIFFNLLPGQKDRLKELKRDFYEAWLLTADSRFRPTRAIFNPVQFVRGKAFRRTLKAYRDLQIKIQKVLRKQPEKFDALVPPMVAKAEKTLQTRFEHLQLQENFKELFTLNTHLNRGLDHTLKDVGGISGRGAPVAMQVIVSTIANPIFAPKRIDIPQFYLFPNGDTTLVLHLFVLGWSALYKKYEPFYEMLKAVYEHLRSWKEGEA